MIGWRERDVPLVPRGAFAPGSVARAWRDRLRNCTDSELEAWVGVGDDSGLLLLGPDLPWVDGLVWLGVDPDATGLYLPCTRMPDVHPALLARRLPLPAALLPDRILPVGHARPVERHRL